MRAMRAVASGADPEIYGNAVYNVMIERGLDPNNNMEIKS
jgi:hypothetical protein